ncbi:MAG: class I SAM-dependent methyltransferase [Cellulomonas sp.]
MISDFADGFWRARAESTNASIRWTDATMLELDITMVESQLRGGDALLDLGCGTGDLFLPLLHRLGSVTAVDMIPEFLGRIPADPKITTVQSNVVEFSPSVPFDLAVMFGVVTHLSLEQETAAYRVLRTAAPAGTVIVKNQCGRDADVDVDRWSEAFASRYVGRYPHVSRQAARLAEVFGSVEVVPYPDAMNKWPDSLHVAFICH